MGQKGKGKDIHLGMTSKSHWTTRHTHARTTSTQINDVPIRTAPEPPRWLQSRSESCHKQHPYANRKQQSPTTKVNQWQESTSWEERPMTSFQHERTSYDKRYLQDKNQCGRESCDKRVHDKTRTSPLPPSPPTCPPTNQETTTHLSIYVSSY